MQEDCLREGHSDAIFQKSHIEGTTLEAVNHNEEMQSRVAWLCLKLNFPLHSPRRVNLGRQFFVLLQLKAVGDFAQTLVLDVALFEDERCVLLHPFTPLVSLAVCVVGVDFNFLNGHEFAALQLNVKLDGFASLAGHNVIELACEVFGGEGEILSQHDLSENVLAIGLFNPPLIVVC